MARELKNTLVSSIHDKQLVQYARSYFHGRLIDIGCGTKPYVALLKPFVSEHVGVDHVDSPHSKASVDLVGTAYDIPTDDSSFDSALCTAVLEHLEEPLIAVKECHRVLRTDGIAIYSVPFIWHLHEEPRDFFRFSKYGLHHLFSRAGFEVVEMKALSGFWVTFGQLFVYQLYRLNRGPLKWLHLIDALGVLIQGCALVCDRIDKTEQWTWMYMVVARKR